MERFEQLYRQWLTDPYFSESTREELAAIADDRDEQYDRFYMDLEFGTGGLRGILGAGTNRMNTYTVARAAEGFARYLEQVGDEAKERGIAISFDCRNGSPEFAKVTAQVMATHGIRSYLFDELHPTPMLSYAVRHLNCAGGVMVTASHNPKAYNGYKVYGEDGGQMPPEAADIVLAEMEKIQDVTTLSWMTYEEASAAGLITIIGEEINQSYNDMLMELRVNVDKIEEQKDMKIVYTPLHGTGNKPVRRALAAAGFENVIVVPEQEQPDGNFSTVKSPNPEERSALQMAIDLAGREDAELVIATDPDGDRMGIAIRMPDGDYQVMTGNQIGLMLMEYILSAKKKRDELLPNSFCVTTIVSSKLTRKIAEAYDVHLFETLTGFKFIAEKIKDYDEDGDGHFLFGFEESFGYLLGMDVRDKDAVASSLIAAELAATMRSESRTLMDFIEEIYRKYGYGVEKTVSIFREGASGAEDISSAMAWLREGGVDILSDIPVKVFKDYQRQTALDVDTGEVSQLDTSPSNVLLYELEGLDWFCVRPSGTEPKIKVYFGCYGDDRAAQEEKIRQLSDQFVTLVNDRLDA